MKKFICKVGDKIRFGNLGTDPKRFNPLTYREAIVEEVYPDLIKFKVTKNVHGGIEQPMGGYGPNGTSEQRGSMTREFSKAFWLDTPMEDVFQVIEKAGA